MPECQLDDCGISCEFGCSCMSDAAGCECCCEHISLPPLKKLRVREARDPEAYVNFSASGMPLVRLAELFDDLFPGQILMPVSKMQEKVTTDEELRQIKLGDLVGYLGLVPVRTPLPGRATPAHRRRGLKTLHRHAAAHRGSDRGGRRPTCQGHQVVWRRTHKGSDNPLTPPS